MPERDYYQILGVERGASQEQIKKAYRRLARQHHPDANSDDPGAADRFKEIGEAYRVLSDPDKRAQYDRFGHAGGEAAGFGGAGGGFGGFDDLFEAFFGGAFGGRQRAGPRPQQGDDISVRLTISFAEAAFGLEREIQVPRNERCPTCGGDGAEPGTSASTCSNCGGSGQVRTGRPTPFGSFYSVSTCPNCAGSGRHIEHLCPECRGRGQVRQQRQIKVRIPGGVEDGNSIRLAGQGESGQHGGPPGDLYVLLRVKPHPTLARRGDDVTSSVEVSYVQAALGTEVTVETLDGPEQLQVPAGIQPGRELVLKGHGITRLRRRGRGDHRVRVRVTIPEHPGAQERQLLQQLAEARGESVRGDDGGILGRVRDAFRR